MKLFKKLAAAALAAVLALSMVGCGAGGTGSALDLKNEVLNLIEDKYYLSGKTATHTTAMDTEAAKLIEKAAADETAKDENVTVKDLLEKSNAGNYIAIFAPYTQLRTEMWQQNYVYDMQGALAWATESHNYGETSSYDNMIVKIGTPGISDNDSIEMGVATGTIKGRNYLVLLVQNARA